MRILIAVLYYCIISVSTVYGDNASVNMYVVKKNDYLYKIAKDFGVSVSSIERLNPKVNFKKPLIVGQKIAIPQKQTSLNNQTEEKFIIHKVINNETIFAIAQKYKIPTAELIKLNNINNNKIVVNQLIKIPKTNLNEKTNEEISKQNSLLSTATKDTANKQTDNESKSEESLTDSTTSSSLEEDLHSKKDQTTITMNDVNEGNDLFIWPTTGRIIKRFGTSLYGYKSEGINIANTEGTPIRAAASGRVVCIDNLIKEFGNIVIIKHFNGFITVYGHIKDPLVLTGNRVKRGQVIAYMGKTGNVTQSQLYFSIRKNHKSYDPMYFLHADKEKEQ